MSIYEIIKISEEKIEFNFESFPCDDIGLFVIGKYPRFKYGDLTNLENFNWQFHTIATIRLTLLNLINRGVIEVYETISVQKYLFRLFNLKKSDYYFKVVDLHLDKDWFSVLVHKAINEVNTSKRPTLSKYIKMIVGDVIYKHSTYKNPSKAFIIQLLRKYSKEFKWIELVREKKFLGFLDDYEVKVEEIYIPRIRMQHEALTNLDNSLFYNNPEYSEFCHRLEIQVKTELKNWTSHNN